MVGWRSPFRRPADGEPTAIDAVISGIVVVGMLGLYGLFLAVQFERLWVDVLPSEFSAAESLVKTGFWQLLALSLLNTACFVACYQRTGPVVRRLLTAFTCASLLILLSATHRMVLYVTFYGFSYEKFYASYAVVFCVVVFAYLIRISFARCRREPIKFGALLFLWMYAVIAVAPVEQIILRSNVALATIPGSRMKVHDLKELSADVLPLIRSYEAQGVLLNDPGARQRRDVSYQRLTDWSEWIERREMDVRKKAWYERNLGNVWSR